MITLGQDSLKTSRKLKVGAKTYTYFSLKALEKQGYDVDRLPFSLKVLLENLLRFEDGRSVTTDDIEALAKWGDKRKSKKEIAYRPARVLMQDFTGVPAVVDLAAMRSAVEKEGGDPKKINPQIPVDLVIDHSVMVDNFGKANSFKRHVKIEYERTKERSEFLRWGSKAFDNFRVVPPGTGICHQVNLEYLAKCVWTDKARVGKGKNTKGTVTVAYPDTLVGTDSHTTMVNGLAVLGWGVGGIEAEAAMLGQPITMLIPEVVGFKLTGKLKSGLTATDMVLTIVEMLRKKGVVGKFVEFYGPGLNHLSLEDQATIANMAPEYGATCGFFPVDKETLEYLKATGRPKAQIDLVEKYAKAQGMFRTSRTPDPVFTSMLELALGDVVPSISGPKRPQDRIDLDKGAEQFAKDLTETFGIKKKDTGKRVPVANKKFDIGHGDVMIAAITSCTNTSNPNVLIAAGLVAKAANERGLKVKPWVKTSLAPGSQVVTDYLEKAGLQDDLDKLGFNLVGYGCTTCIGNSGPLDEDISEAINKKGVVATSVLSGNRNFEGRIGPDIQANYLASPPLVVAYAIAGSLNVNVAKDALGTDRDGNPVYLKDLWPSSKEIADIVRKVVTPKMFRTRYGDVFKGDAAWQKVKVKESLTYAWDMTSTYVQHPPYFEGEAGKVKDVEGAHILGVFGDSVTTDHISPAGAIKADGPAGKYLMEHQVRSQDFNSYGSRRGNHEVMMRGTFANIRIKNEMVPGTEGGVTVHHPSVKTMSIFDAAMKYQKKDKQLVVFGGKEYGTGSSRDWAAKGTTLLGVSAVIVESFERIHRSNLIGMGVLPLQFKKGTDRKTLKLDGSETVTIKGLGKLKPRQTVTAEITYKSGKKAEAKLLCRIDTEDELDYYKSGGILQYVLGNLAA